MKFIDVINSIHGQVWLVLIAFTAMLLLYLRYRNTPPAASLVDSLNSIHVALLGFVICLMAVMLMMAGHAQEGDKVFLSGASFIGGIAAVKATSGNGNGNGGTKP